MPLVINSINVQSKLGRKARKGYKNEGWIEREGRKER